jgi:hypothetical protein
VIKITYFVKYWLPALPSLVAFITLVYSIKHQNKIDKDTNERIERTQASRVSAWEDFEDHEEKIIVRNGNDSPIYNLFVFMCRNIDKSDIDSLIEKLNSDGNLGKFQETFPPGKKTFHLIDSHAMGNDHYLPAILFTDSQNISWFRHANGYLEKLSNYNYLDRIQKQGFVMRHV